MEKEIMHIHILFHLGICFSPVSSLSLKHNSPCHFWAQIFIYTVTQMYKVMRNYSEYKEQNIYGFSMGSRDSALIHSHFLKSPLGFSLCCFSKTLEKLEEFSWRLGFPVGTLKLRYVLQVGSLHSYKLTYCLVSLGLDILGQAREGMQTTYHITILHKNQ